MNKILIGLVSIAAIIAIGASLVFLTRRDFTPHQGGGRSNTENADISGKQTYHLTVDGVEREFIVYRPEDLSADVETPVVFMFHGTSGTGEKFYNISGWKEKADDEGITVIFPTALQYHLIDDKVLSSGKIIYDSQVYPTKWTHYKIEDMLDPAYPNQVLHDDVDFTQAMVDFTKENYPVDEARFYATGFSNGAQFTSRLAVEMSDTFAAFAVGGSGNVSYEDISHVNDHTDAPFVARPMMTGIGSVDDRVVHALGVSEIPTDESLMAEDSGIKKAVVNPFLELAELEDAYTYEVNETVSSYTFSEPVSGEGDAEYILLILDGMGHMYANGKNYPVAYVNIFWPFFEQYSL